MKYLALFFAALLLLTLPACCFLSQPADANLTLIEIGYMLSGALIVGMSYAVGDKNLKVTKALPSGASSVTSDAIDLGHETTGKNLAEHEFLVEAPALAVGQLANSSTMTYAVVTSANSDLSSPTVVNASLLVQTGAGGVGAAAAEARFRLPTDCKRYVGVKATNSAAADASAASVTLSLKF